VDHLAALLGLVHVGGDPAIVRSWAMTGT
jgi:hypothetical protein